MLQLFLSLMLLLACLMPQVSKAQVIAEDVMRLLLKSADTLRNKSYVGYFNYQYGSVLESLEVVHRYYEGKVIERITHLNGTQRTFYSRGDECVNGQSTTRPYQGAFPGFALTLADNSLHLSEYYNFYMQGTDRYAGRPAYLMNLVPKDQHRLGVLIAFDQDSALPLMVLINSTKQKALERFQFVKLDFDNVPELDTASVSANAPAVDCDKPFFESRWQARWIPKGYRLVRSIKNEEQEHSYYTDGVSSFTLFIGPMTERSPTYGGTEHRGATVAVMDVATVANKPTHVSLVGEVPFETARKIVRSVKLRNH